MVDNYETFKKEYLRLSGIDLSSYKESQMKRRIDNFIMKQGMGGYQPFFDLIKRDSDVYDKFITYLTINVSEFYRNPLQWKNLEEKVIPALLEKFGSRKPFTIWSAACSTGDEPYSLAMVMSEFLALNQVKIIATDMDMEVLGKAKKGYYPEKSLKGLPQKYKTKFIEDDGSGVVKVSDKLKSCISFQQHNLLKDSYPQGVHMIVCRNVMIYFTEDAKDEIYKKFAASLCQGGVLFVGSTEQIIGPAKYGFLGLQSFFYEKG